jgi:hypothetical protein
MPRAKDSLNGRHLSLLIYGLKQKRRIEMKIKLRKRIKSKR